MQVLIPPPRLGLVDGDGHRNGVTDSGGRARHSDRGSAGCGIVRRFLAVVTAASDRETHAGNEQGQDCHQEQALSPVGSELFTA